MDYSAYLIAFFLSFMLLLPFRAKINQILFISAAGLNSASSMI